MNSPDHALESGPRKLRGFIAVKTPGAWDEKLGELQRHLKSKFGSGEFRWVKPGQIHITLRFFGWVTTLQAQEIAQLLGPICSAHHPFDLSCEGLGAFPNVTRPRVLWAGLKGDILGAALLQKEITAATSPFGEPPEDRPFKPHLTLARIKDSARKQATDLEHAIARGFKIDDPWTVTEVLLMQSHLSPEGSTYETLGSFQLGG